MRPIHYKLDGKKPVPCDLTEMAKVFESDRGVAQTKIGDVTISTVFLCIDHQFGDGPPVLFETMIFGGQFDQYMQRYHTWEEAEAGHGYAVDFISCATDQEPKDQEPKKEEDIKCLGFGKSERSLDI